MTLLSVNVNKIALLRNARGTDYPKLVDFVHTVIGLGARGITVHPRPDERHVTRKDVRGLAHYLQLRSEVEFNIEGYPSDEFMELVLEVKPDQCTLVPDAPGQLTSDHGWDVAGNRELLERSLARLAKAGIRSSLFVDPGFADMDLLAKLGADRVELYTEEFARHYGLESESRVWRSYADTARAAQDAGLGVNAGHDLNLQNLGRFLDIPDVLEVSIGHALVVEAIYQGLEPVIKQYLSLTGEA